MNKRKKKQTTLKKNNILRAGVILALLFGLFIFSKLTYAKNVTYYPYNDGFFTMNIYINGEMVSIYKVECKANELEDIPGTGHLKTDSTFGLFRTNQKHMGTILLRQKMLVETYNRELPGHQTEILK